MASKLFPHVFTPGRIGTLELKNRVMKAPQSSGMSNKDGTVSERLIRYYRNQASGGAGMIIVEYAYVDDIGAKSAHCHLGISQNEHIPGLTWLAENIKECGAAAGIQIEHCGRQKFLGTQPMCAPSAIPWPKLWDQYGLQAVPHVLTIEEIQDIVHAFGDAAWRAKVAGFDLVEIHGAHGYLLTNFFSPTTNHRTDLYGGTLENRMRIYIEIARDVRKKVGPDFPVTIRLSGTDYEPDGFPIEDTLVLAKALENEGIDAFHISGGDHHTMIHQTSPMAMDHGHNVWAAEAIKKVVSVPVIASGGAGRLARGLGQESRSSPPAPSTRRSSPRRSSPPARATSSGWGARSGRIPSGLRRPRPTTPRTSVPASAATRAASSAPSTATRPSAARSTRRSAARASWRSPPPR